MASLCQHASRKAREIRYIAGALVTVVFTISHFRPARNGNRQRKVVFLVERRTRTEVRLGHALILDPTLTAATLLDVENDVAARGAIAESEQL